VTSAQIAHTFSVHLVVESPRALLYAWCRLVEGQGIDPASPEYYAEIEKAVSERFADRWVGLVVSVYTCLLFIQR
jgi:hypothetical protein